MVIISIVIHFAASVMLPIIEFEEGA